MLQTRFAADCKPIRGDFHSEKPTHVPARAYGGTDNTRPGGACRGTGRRFLVRGDYRHRSADDTWTAGIYGRNATDERYTNALINVGDYILRILSNDASEFGVRFIKDF